MGGILSNFCPKFNKYSIGAAIAFIAALLVALYYILKPQYYIGAANDYMNNESNIPINIASVHKDHWLITEDDIELYFISCNPLSSVNNDNNKNIKEIKPILFINGGPGMPPRQCPNSLIKFVNKINTINDPNENDNNEISSSYYYYELFIYHQRGTGYSTHPFSQFNKKDTSSWRYKYSILWDLHEMLGFSQQLLDIERIRQFLLKQKFGNSNNYKYSPKISLISHSFGTMFSTLYAAEFPTNVENLILINGAPLLMFPPITEGFNLFDILEKYLKLSIISDLNSNNDNNNNNNENSESSANIIENESYEEDDAIKKKIEENELYIKYKEFKDFEFNFYNWVQHSQIELLNLHFKNFMYYYQLSKLTYFNYLLKNNTITQNDYNDIETNCWNTLPNEIENSENSENDNDNNNNDNNMQETMIDKSKYMEGGYMTAAIYFDMGLWHNWKSKMSQIFLNNEESYFDANTLIIHSKYDLQSINASFDYATVFSDKTTKLIEIDHVTADHMLIYYDINKCQSTIELVNEMAQFWKENEAKKLEKINKKRKKSNNVCKDGETECFEQI